MSQTLYMAWDMCRVRPLKQITILELFHLLCQQQHHRRRHFVASHIDRLVDKKRTCEGKIKISVMVNVPSTS